MDTQSQGNVWRGGRRGRGRGRDRREEEDKDVRLSKSLSYVLRHGANSLGLHLNSDGFIYVEDILAHAQFRHCSLEDVERVVARNDKKRFKLRPHPEDGRLQIRANQGHSLQLADLDLKPVLAGSADCPCEAVHWSYLRNWTSIRSQGLSRMTRMHIHLVPDLPGDSPAISGKRKDCDLVIFIDVPKALSDGIQFFWSENGVLLSPGDADGRLLPRFFSRALSLKPTRETPTPEMDLFDI